MNIKSTSFLFLLLMAVLPAFGQVAAPYDNRHDGSVKDERAHIDAKTKWIKENPEAYRKAGGDPEAVIGTQPSAKTESSPAKLPAFKATKTFKLAEVSAVPASGSKASAAELKAETENLKKEFPVGTSILQYGEENRIRVSLGGKSELRGTQTRQGSQLVWDFPDPNCVACDKKLLLQVVSEGSNSFVVVMDSEDENAAFAYRFVFNTTNQ